MDIQPSFKADSQLAKACKPAVRALHHTPVLAQPFTETLTSFNGAASESQKVIRQSGA